MTSPTQTRGLDSSRLLLPPMPDGFYWQVEFIYVPEDDIDQIVVSLKANPWPDGPKPPNGAASHWSAGKMFYCALLWKHGEIDSAEKLDKFRTTAEELGRQVLEQYERARRFQEPLHNMLGIYGGGAAR